MCNSAQGSTAQHKVNPFTQIYTLIKDMHSNDTLTIDKRFVLNQ